MAAVSFLSLPNMGRELKAAFSSGPRGLQTSPLSENFCCPHPRAQHLVSSQHGSWKENIQHVNPQRMETKDGSGKPYGTALAREESDSFFNQYLRDPIKHVSFVFINNKNGTYIREIRDEMFFLSRVNINAKLKGRWRSF